MAEVYARTWYELTASAPLALEEKIYTGEAWTRRALVFCGHRINFFAGSGILPAQCDKIISEQRLELEGVFTLPVSFVREKYRRYDTVTVTRGAESLRPALEAALTERLLAELGESGKVGSTVVTAAESDGVLYVTLRAECSERVDSIAPWPTT